MNVFVIRSPFSYVNALELRNKLDLQSEQCKLLFAYTSKDDVDVDHIKRIFDPNIWGSLIFFPKNFSSFLAERERGSKGNIFSSINFFLLFRSYVCLIHSLLNGTCDVKRVIVQNIDEYSFVHIANFLNPDCIYCLDEGPKTLWTSKVRANIVSSEVRFRSILQYCKRGLMRFLYDYDVRPLKNVIFFSCYNFELAKDEEILINDYGYMRSLSAANAQDTGSVYFIGSSLSEVGIMEENLYLDYLEKIKRFFNEKEMKYISHRADSLEKLDRIRNEIGLEVISFDIPFELQVSVKGPVPFAIASFYSAVLINCHEMFQYKIKTFSFRIPKEVLSEKNIDSISTVYEYFSGYDRPNFTLLDVEYLTHNNGAL